jgi:hypothetical protein
MSHGLAERAAASSAQPGRSRSVVVGLPHTIAVDVKTTPDGRLLLATHGRGLWAIPVSALD